MSLSCCYPPSKNTFLTKEDNTLSCLSGGIQAHVLFLGCLIETNFIHTGSKGYAASLDHVPSDTALR